jgi:hypothetical protein
MIGSGFDVMKTRVDSHLFLLSNGQHATDARITSSATHATSRQRLKGTR